MGQKMTFLEEGAVFYRDTTEKTPEEMLKYVMALPHIAHETCWCQPRMELSMGDDDSDIFIHHYPH